MRQNESPVQGEFAKDIRLQLWRIATGHQNDADRAMAGLHEEVMKGQQYQISWSK